METTLSDRLQRTAAFLRERGVGRPRAAFVLGSGLSGVLAPEESVSVPFAEIPGFPAGTLAGHDRRLEFGRVAGHPVLVLHGRAHHYEGVDLPTATFPVRVAHALGAEWIVLMNASGALNPEYRVGDLVLLSDHINLIGDNPLIGPNDDAVGPRFPDLSRAYPEELRARARAAADAAGVPVREGVYAAVCGPHYETAAELRMLRILGADLVGMSTVPETIAAVHQGLPVLGLSVVTDLAHPEALEPLSHADVLRAAGEAGQRAGKILRGLIEGVDA